MQMISDRYIPEKYQPYLRIETCSWKYDSRKGPAYDPAKSCAPQDYLVDYAQYFNTVETRNPNYLTEDLFAFLRDWGLGFVMLEGCYMPPIADVTAAHKVHTAHCSIIRLHDPVRRSLGGNCRSQRRRIENNGLYYRAERREGNQWTLSTGDNENDESSYGMGHSHETA